ncbi:MAG: hypothetical protein NTW03_15465, partial [Verrucomicrobia bacterium]|nr:hypothetical protein [Verrucomicrobiota bacterium]
MRTDSGRIVWMGALFLLGAPAWSEGQPVPPAAPAVAATVPAAPPAGPQIRFATPSYDFGKAPAGQLVKYD